MVVLKLRTDLTAGVSLVVDFFDELVARVLVRRVREVPQAHLFDT